MINENIKANGELLIILKDQHGNVKQQLTTPNLVVTVGKSVIASRLTGSSTAVMSHMALGTGSSAPVAANTTLDSEIVGGRVALVTVGGTAVNNEVTYTTTFGAGIGTGAIVEAGIFNASSLGSMLCRTTFSVVSKEISDTLTITWKITIS